MSAPPRGSTDGWTVDWDHGTRWESPRAALRDHGGPSRVVTDEPAPEGWRPRPVGFVIDPGTAGPISALFREAGHR
jgi:hypothetical protein